MIGVISQCEAWSLFSTSRSLPRSEWRSADTSACLPASCDHVDSSPTTHAPYVAVKRDIKKYDRTENSAVGSAAVCVLEALEDMRRSGTDVKMAAVLGSVQMCSGLCG